MKILVGCEESQAVCLAFREAGHEAFSCDLKPCSGGHPENKEQIEMICRSFGVEFGIIEYNETWSYLTVKTIQL